MANINKRTQRIHIDTQPELHHGHAPVSFGSRDATAPGWSLTQGLIGIYDQGAVLKPVIGHPRRCILHMSFSWLTSFTKPLDRATEPVRSIVSHIPEMRRQCRWGLEVVGHRSSQCKYACDVKQFTQNSNPFRKHWGRRLFPYLGPKLMYTSLYITVSSRAWSRASAPHHGRHTPEL